MIRILILDEDENVTNTTKMLYTKKYFKIFKMEDISSIFFCYLST